MLTKTQLKTIFSEYGLAPLKSLGENYLIDANIKDKIIAASSVKKDDTVLEIGPGLGALTMDLVKIGASIFAVEKDRKAAAILKELAGEGLPNLKIFHEDILKFDFTNMPPKKKIKVVGSLPYYITTPILERLIENRTLFESILIVIQKEVAYRLLAKPGTKDYGSISCFVQYHARPVYLYTIKRTCFYPSPDVDSSLIRLEMLKYPSVEVKNEGLLFKIIRGSFNQRRKSIINSLSREEVLGIEKDKLSEILDKAGVSVNARPEVLSLSDFARIANYVNVRDGK